jgi:hypothetical protein
MFGFINCLSLPDFVIQAGFLYRTFGSAAVEVSDTTMVHNVKMLVNKPTLINSCATNTP